jgi:hypothetical protein
VTRVFENRGFWWRQTLSLIAVILIAVYGAWELWSATFSTGEYVSPMGELLGIGDDRYAFGILFLGGGIYAAWQLIEDSRDTVATFAMDDKGASVTTLWRPLRSLTLTADAGAVRDWRFHVKIGKRNARSFFIYADHSSYPHPLQFDLRRNDAEGLRQVAPDAVAEYDAATRPPTPQ